MRTKEFDVEGALDRAVDLFWRKGYAATTLPALLQHMRIGRQSLYDTFGGKRRLFLAALDRYSARKMGELLGELETPGASRASIRRCLERIVAFQLSCSPRRACLLANSAMELGVRDPEVARRVASNRTRLERAFLRALRAAAVKGEIRGGSDLASRARFLAGTALGIGVVAKSGASRQALRDLVRVSLTAIE